ILSIPVALGCALFPQIGVAFFSRESFRPAEDNLRVMAFMVALVYFSMPLGSCLLAAGKQKMWSLVQCLCVVVSLVLNPLLVPFFQGRMGNGGVGLGVASVISEALMIGFGIALVPRGVIDRRLTRLIGLTLVAGAAMAGAAFLAKSLTVFVAAPLSLAVY